MLFAQRTEAEIDGLPDVSQCSRTDDEAEIIGATHRHIRCQRTALSTTSAAQSRYLRIQVKMGTATLRQLIWMGSERQFLLAPRQSRR